MSAQHDSIADKTLISVDIPSQIASANVNGTAIDMQGWDGCAFVFNLGAMTSSATFDARVVNSANANMSGATNITNAALVQVTTANANAVAIIDVYRPTLRYLRTAVQPAAANSQFASIAIRYRRSGTLPPTAAAIQTVRVAVN